MSNEVAFDLAQGPTFFGRGILGTKLSLALLLPPACPCSRDEAAPRKTAGRQRSTPPRGAHLSVGHKKKGRGSHPRTGYSAHPARHCDESKFQFVMSALRLKADMCSALTHVCGHRSISELRSRFSPEKICERRRGRPLRPHHLPNRIREILLFIHFRTTCLNKARLMPLKLAPCLP